MAGKVRENYKLRPEFHTSFKISGIEYHRFKQIRMKKKDGGRSGERKLDSQKKVYNV